MLSHGTSAVLAAFLAVFVIACDKSADTPTSPTQPGPVPTETQVVSGVIQSTTAPNMIVVSGQMIVLEAGARIVSGMTTLTFSDLKPGARVRVTLVLDGASQLHASLVEEILESDGVPSSHSAS